MPNNDKVAQESANGIERPSAKGGSKRFKDRKSFQSKKKSSESRKGSEVSKPKDDLFNDISWHNKYSELLDTVAKIPFNRLGGMYVPLDSAAGTIKVVRPSVMRLGFYMSIGRCIKESDGFQAEIRKLYLAMKRKYRGLNTYETADLAYVILAITSFFLWLAKGERIYGVLNYYAIQNRDVPYTIARALRIDYKNFNSHLADFRAGLNYLITRAKSLCLPQGISALERWIFLESNIFKDSRGSRSSLYLFDIDEVQMFSGSVMDTGSACIGLDYATNFNDPVQMEYNEFLGVGEELLEALLTDDDVTLILGDLVSYYTQSNNDIAVMTMNEVPEGYTVIPGYSEEILSQIHNAGFNTQFHKVVSAVGGWVPTYSNLPGGTYLDVGCVNWHDFAQSGGVCVHKPYIGDTAQVNFTPLVLDGFTYDHAMPAQFPTNYGIVMGDRLLDTWVDVPSVADVTEMTRLSMVIEPIFGLAGSNPYWAGDLTSTGTEIITSCVLVPSLYAANQSELGLVQAPTAGSLAVTEMQITNFDWHPIIYKADQTTVTVQGNTYHYITLFPDGGSILGDLDNFRVLTAELLKGINDVVIMSNFKVDSIGQFEGSAANRK